MKIIIGGDVVPTESSESFFKECDPIENIDEDFAKRWLEANVRVFNLECPLGDVKKMKPIKKSGPNLVCSERCINGIKSLKPSVVCLANNHICDYGVNGLKNTSRLLSEAGVQTIGILDNINSRPKVFYYSKDGIRVGIYNICETEFCNATYDDPGADPYRENCSCEMIRKIKDECDFLVVVYHGGKEFYRYPSPRLQDRCRAFVRAGADFVTCQHSHCIGCEEKYLKGRILYGQGNFLFDSGNDEFWNNGLAVELDVKKSGSSVDYIVLEKKSPTFVISKDTKILEDFQNRSKKVYDRHFVEEEYGRFADKKLNEYLDMLCPHTFLDRVYRKLFGRYPAKKKGQQYYLDTLNSVRCEAHREVLVRGLEDKGKC